MRFSDVSPFRRMVVRLTVGSFAVAALMGIAALLAPGRMGDLEARVLLTTVVIGATNVLMLCYVAIGHARHHWPGVLGGVAAVVAAACALDMVWGHWQHDPDPWLLRSFGVSGVSALTLAQFSLLLAVASRRATITPLLRWTVAVGTVLATLLIAAILGWDPGDAGARLIGVVAILDVLGTVVTIAIAVIGGGDRRTSTLIHPPPRGDTMSERLRARAEASGRDPAELVLDVLPRSLASADVPSRAEGAHAGEIRRRPPR